MSKVESQVEERDKYLLSLQKEVDQLKKKNEESLEKIKRVE